MQHQQLTTFARGGFPHFVNVFIFVGGLVGKETAFFSGSMALVWPPAGIAMAAILVFGYRYWSGVALGAFMLCVHANGTPLSGVFTLGTAVRANTHGGHRLRLLC